MESFPLLAGKSAAERPAAVPHDECVDTGRLRAVRGAAGYCRDRTVRKYLPTRCSPRQLYSRVALLQLLHRTPPHHWTVRAARG
jgi:hypothetical protein